MKDETPIDLDAFLDSDEANVEVEKVDIEAEESDEVAALKAQVAAMSLLIAEMGAAKDLSADGTEELNYSDPAGEGDEVITFHVKEDGLTFNGKVWYRGEEGEFVVGSEAYNQTLDRNGNSWTDIIGDEQAQYRKWGQRFLAPGPWTGLSYEEVIKRLPEGSPEAEDFKKAAVKAAAARRSVPLVPGFSNKE